MKRMPSILIIDPNEASVQRLKGTFEAEGYFVVATSNSNHAEKLFIQHKPCVVILDLFMPEKDGFEVTRAIREICPSCFILALSCHSRYLRAIKILGANIAFHKSVPSKAILNTIKAL